MDKNKIKKIIQEAEKHYKTKIPVPTVYFRAGMKRVLAYTSFQRNSIVIAKDLENQAIILDTILKHEIGHHIAFHVFNSNQHCADWFNVCLYLSMEVNDIREIMYV